MQRPSKSWVAVAMVVAAGLVDEFTPFAMAQYSNIAHATSQGGQISTGATYQSISCVGQSVGAVVSEGGDFVNHAGFMSAFSISPELDTDGDGLADELDSDNDNDGLPDEGELTGSWFIPAHPTSPNNPDTDGDGQGDGDELVAGTDPTTASSVFGVAAVTASGSVHVTVVTQPDRSYRIFFADRLTSTGSVWHAFINTNSGQGTWFETSSLPSSFTFLDDYSTNASGYQPTNRLRYYRVNTSRP